ncbi:oligopeptide/dipeptide ABC transporter ATP-binding protein [Roseofilum sp. Belize Diploria]|uniref:ABC transporter ATP-binding protein n=1 Tax=Roseofilum sp. Belize Diploria TaxID=2821501 RepID=UPI001B1F44F5|nr:oligopeptide/dipeptide ABC transporter ATP-binding protein [Roseofilum sp. Belize Diploria]MBP0009284.1 ATP-binding cassette domain-containing protein [Roseofilum sp. Belize Diploria]
MTPLISVRNLQVHYPVGGGFLHGKPKIVRAVDGVSFDIMPGQIFGLVGESGSGKTTVGRAILKAAPITGGEIMFKVADLPLSIAKLEGERLKALRREAQMIFQDPYAALSPRMTVRDIIAEPLEAMQLTKNRQETNQRVREVAERCRLNLEHLRRFPHAFSGGQRQRIAIARALVSGPSFLVADESVAALDVSIQANILNLLKALQEDMNLTFLFISHDLSVIAHFCDVVAVMYLGQIVEIAPTHQLFSNPSHPYTQALLSAIPPLDPDDERSRIRLLGEIPSPVNPPSGCRFHTRCPVAESRCKTVEPIWTQISDKHGAACHLVEDRLANPINN